jgi:hypothetical protein
MKLRKTTADRLAELRRERDLYGEYGSDAARDMLRALAVKAVARGATRDEAAEAAGVSTATLAAWITEDTH